MRNAECRIQNGRAGALDVGKGSRRFLGTRILPHLLRRSPLSEGAFRGKKPDLKAPSGRELSRSD